jgi:hypothetical protein
MQGTGIDADEHLYRKLTGARGDNLPSYQHEKMLSIVRYLYRTNPVAQRFVTIMCDFILGEGVSLSFQNDQVRDVVMRHWKDQYNDWGRNAADLLTTYLVAGELLMPLFPNPVDGHLRVGCVLPDHIADVRTDIENWRVVGQVALKNRPGEEPRVYDVVNIREGKGRLKEVERPALFWKRQNPLGSRGISILYTVADFLDLLDQMVYNEVERALLLKAFIWVVTVKDATIKELQDLAQLPQYANPPKPGAVIMQNEKISWDAKTPELDSYDAATLMRFLRNHVLGAGGIPEHWWSEGGDVNRAVGTVMAEPTRKRLTNLQDEWRCILGDVIHCQIDYAVIHGMLPELVPIQDAEGNDTAELIEAGNAFSIGMPDLSPADTHETVTSLQTLVQTLMIAVEEGYISEATSRRIFLMMATQLGMDFNVEEEAARAAAEHAARASASVEQPSSTVFLPFASGRGAMDDAGDAARAAAD